MKLSVLIPVGGELETDPWRRHSFEWVRRRYEALLPDAEICLGTSSQTPYNRAQARNHAFAQSTGDMLLVADGDTVFNPPQIFKAIQLIREIGAHWVIPYEGHTNAVDPESHELGRYYNLSATATDYLLGAPPNAEIDEPAGSDLWEFKLTSWAGLLVLPRTAWEAAGGYDENFLAWGFEDNAFRFALEHKVGPFTRVSGPAGFALHLWHPSSEENRFGQPSMEHNRALCARYERGELP